MKLTQEILVELGFKKKGKKWSRGILELSENQQGTFEYSLIAGKLHWYIDISTIERLQTFWRVIDPKNKYPLPIKSLSCYQDQFLELPDWVNFIATDWNGEKFGYLNRPNPSDDQWKISVNWEVDSESECIQIGEAGTVCLEWKDSLIERKKR